MIEPRQAALNSHRKRVPKLWLARQKMKAKLSEPPRENLRQVRNTHELTFGAE